MIYKLLQVFIPLLLISACSQEGVAGADGDTPVKYVVCMSGQQSCALMGRFSNLDVCQSYKEWGEMVCDRQSQPGKMVCEKNVSSTTSYCTL